MSRSFFVENGQNNIKHIIADYILITALNYYIILIRLPVDEN